MAKETKKKDTTEEDKQATGNHRLTHALSLTESARLTRMEGVKAKTGRTDLPLESRKLTQQEAAAYCRVSTMTIHRWVKAGLKTVQYGARKRFLINDLKEYMKNNLSK
ncbi:MAG: helix-turn-helix domain-containing protein [Desulfobulbus sp.]